MRRGGADPLASQIFDLSANAADIDAGRIGYSLSAFFTTYLDQRDFGTVRVLFLGGGNLPLTPASPELGRASIGGPIFVGSLPVAGSPTLPGARAWGQDFLSGFVPVGTRSIQIELDGEKEPGIGAVADGYIDVVNLSLVAVPEPGPLPLVGLGLGLVSGWFYFRRRR